jgi:hypothetical protein
LLIFFVADELRAVEVLYVQALADIEQLTAELEMLRQTGVAEKAAAAPAAASAAYATADAQPPKIRSAPAAVASSKPALVTVVEAPLCVRPRKVTETEQRQKIQGARFHSPPKSIMTPMMQARRFSPVFSRCTYSPKKMVVN